MITLPQGRCKHFTFITDKNKIVSVGWNQLKTHTLAKYHGYCYYSIHSELHSIINFQGDKDELRKHTFINVRIGESGLMISKPCKNCQTMLGNYGITKIWYSTQEGFKKYDASTDYSI